MHPSVSKSSIVNPQSSFLERETGIEPATNSLEGCDSTTELLPPSECQVGSKKRQVPACHALSTLSAHSLLPTLTSHLAFPTQHLVPASRSSHPCAVRLRASRYGGHPPQLPSRGGWWRGEDSNLRSR